MIKPTKYKSVTTSALKNRPVSLLTQTQKTKVLNTLEKLTELIKLKHS
jgi:hypothetical protein